MQKPNQASVIALIVLVITVIAIFLPLFVLLAINSLFSLEIPYTFGNWFWTFLLIMVFGNGNRGDWK